jgi:hypothetical protein
LIGTQLWNYWKNTTKISLYFSGSCTCVPIMPQLSSYDGHYLHWLSGRPRLYQSLQYPTVYMHKYTSYHC